MEILHCFAWALNQLKGGEKLQRDDWDNQTYIYIVDSQLLDEDTEIHYPHISMVTADGFVVPWVATHQDLLFFDWRIV